MSIDPASGGDQHGRHGQSPYPGGYGQQGDQPAYPGAYGSHAEPGSGYPGYQATQQAGYGQAPPQWGQAAAPQPGWPGAQPAGSAPGGIPTAGGGSFLSALFDLSFSSFATPVVTKALYVLGLVVIALGWLGFTLTTFFTSGALAGLMVLLLGGVVALFYLIFLRVTLEFYFAVVRMAEDVRQMRNRSSQ